jgi:hypothetical protein
MSTETKPTHIRQVNQEQVGTGFESLAGYSIVRNGKLIQEANTFNIFKGSSTW